MTATRSERGDFQAAGAVLALGCSLVPLLLIKGAVAKSMPGILPIAAAVAVLLLAAELLWVPVEFGPVALHLTLSELAVVPGLLFLPLPLLIAMRGAMVVTDDVRARRSLAIAVYNQGAMVFETLLAAVVFGFFAQPGSATLTSSETVGLVGACTVACLVSACLQTRPLMRIRRQPVDAHAANAMMVACGVNSLLFSGLGAIGIVLWQHQPYLLPVVVVFLGWGVFNARKWVTTEQRLQRTRRLYEFARLLETSPDTQTGAGAILAEIQQILAARDVELILPGAINRRESVVFSTDGTRRVTALDDRSRAALAGDLGPIIHVKTTPGRPDADLDRRNAKELLLAPLRASGQTVDGLLTVVDRQGIVSHFTDEDENLLQAIASHLGLWLERSKLTEQLGQELRLREHQALHDDLTSLPNRRGLAEASTHLFDTPPKPGMLNALALVDLNRFKEINDTLGHSIGDRLLGHVATRLRNTLPRGWIVSRLGGDEFVVMAGNLDTVETLGRTVRSVLRDHYHLDGVEVLVDAAIGIAVIGEHGDDIETLLRHADVAMYEAKHHHLPMAVYSPPAVTPSREWLSITAQLDRGIRNHELVVHYQPKIDLASGIVAGLEALVRWQHPNGELVPPDTFISLAEDSGLAGPLFANVLTQALGQMHEWQQDGLDMHVAVNMSARNLSDPTLVATVTETMHRFGTARGHLTLELTETAAVTNHEVAVQSLTALRELGVRTSLDDFGTGNSPLRLLHDLPVDELKIDRSFVRAMSSDPSGRHIVANLVQLARDLGKSIVAEGVEDATIHGLLVGMGCDVGQGYHYARPADAATITVWLQQHFENAGVSRPMAFEMAESFGLYAVLGVNSDASRLDITRAYAAAFHAAADATDATDADGDRADSAEQAATLDAIRAAFEVLTNPMLRVRHDRDHRAAAHAAASAAENVKAPALPSAPTLPVGSLTALAAARRAGGGADPRDPVEDDDALLTRAFDRAFSGQRGGPRSA